MKSGQPLANVGVLVTRPAEQAVGLMDRLHDLGAVPLLFSALAILPPSRPEQLRAALARLNDYDLLIFVSPTAVLRGMAAISAHGDGVFTPRGVAAVGTATAAALRKAGMHSVLVAASGADSEHLLALPELADLAGQRVLIFRGEGGRELIADMLRERGAAVDYAECYRRGRPVVDSAPLEVAFRQGRVQAITVFSGETLDNLRNLLGQRVWHFVQGTPVFVVHTRIAERAHALDIADVIVTPPGEAGLIAGLVEYFGHD